MEKITFDIKQCKHLNIHEIDGFNTCIDCGIVLDTMVFEKSNINKEERSHSTIPKIKNSILYELYSKNKISKDLMLLCDEYIIKWYKQKIPLRKHHVYFSLYYCSRKINFPLSLKEISKIFNVSVKKICILEKFIPIEYVFSPYEYIVKYCKSLSLKEIDIKNIYQRYQSIESMINKRIHVLIASLIFLYKPELKIRNISSITHVTEHSIKKCSIFLKEKYFIKW